MVASFVSVSHNHKSEEAVVSLLTNATQQSSILDALIPSVDLTVKDVDESEKSVNKMHCFSYNMSKFFICFC